MTNTKIIWLCLLAPWAGMFILAMALHRAFRLIDLILKALIDFAKVIQCVNQAQKATLEHSKLVARSVGLTKDDSSKQTRTN